MGTSKKLALVSGAGAGLGQSLLARFEAGGFIPVGLGRTQPETIIGAFHTLDMADESAVPAVISGVIAKHGPPSIVVHNTAELVIAPFTDTTLADHQRTWTSMVQAAILLAHQPKSTWTQELDLRPASEGF